MLKHQGKATSGLSETVAIWSPGRRLSPDMDSASILILNV